MHLCVCVCSRLCLHLITKISHCNHTKHPWTFNFCNSFISSTDTLLTKSSASSSTEGSSPVSCDTNKDSDSLSATFSSDCSSIGSTE